MMKVKFPSPCGDLLFLILSSTTHSQNRLPGQFAAENIFSTYNHLIPAFQPLPSLIPSRAA